MRRFIALVLASVLALSLCACDSKEKKMEDKNRGTFYQIHEAFEKTDEIGKQIVSVWELSNNKWSSLDSYSNGFDFFAENVPFTRDELLNALAHCRYNTGGEGSLDYHLNAVKNNCDLYFSKLLDDYKSYGLILLVIEVYKQNGQLGEIESLLSSAKGNIKSLSEDRADNEHYEMLKKYFTATNAYYNFCCAPSGTLQDAYIDIQQYNETAEECYNSMYYFFE